MKDQELLCSCGTSWTLTIGQQEFFASRGLALPKRCAPCRRLRKQQLIEAQRPIQNNPAGRRPQ